MVLPLLAAVSLLGPAQDGARRIVPQHRLDRLRSGVNISRWFRQPASTEPAKLHAYIPDAEIQFMKDLGLRHVRIPVDLQLLMTQGGGVDAKMANTLEDTIHRFNGHGMGVVLSISNQYRKKTEGNEQFMAEFNKFWGNLAGRYAVNDPELLYFEVLNEPEYLGKEQLWIRYQEALVKTIRKAAPQHTVIVMGPGGGGLAGFHKLRKLSDLNVVYSFHFYEPYLTTQMVWSQRAAASQAAKRAGSSGRASAPAQRAAGEYTTRKGNPARFPAAYTPPPTLPMYTTVPPYGDPNWSRYQLWSRVDYPIWWGAENKVPIYCGAFGISQKSTTSDRRALWYDALRQAFTSNKTGWAVWSWDEGYGLVHQNVGEKVLVDQAVAQGLGLQTDVMLTQASK